jgi:hypothetical protein
MTLELESHRSKALPVLCTHLLTLPQTGNARRFPIGCRISWLCILRNLDQWEVATATGGLNKAGWRLTQCRHFDEATLDTCLKMRRDFDTPVRAPLVRVSTPMWPPPRSESWDFGRPPLETDGRVHAG